MDAPMTDEHASHVDTTSHSAPVNPDKPCETEVNARDVEDGGQQPAIPNTGTAPANSSPTIECHVTNKNLPAPLQLPDDSSASSATASPVSPTSATCTPQQLTVEANAPSSLAQDSCKDLGKKKYCEFPGCTVQPTFNFPGERGGSHCGTHRLDGQINTVNKMCEVPGCFVRPSFKFPVRGAASQRCARHKLPGMVGNSGKLTGRAFSKGPTSAGDDATLPTLPQSSPVTSTPKRARGELLRIQREQMMRILGEGSAEAEAKPTASPQDCSSALPAKKMKNSSPSENSGDVECETTAKSACSTPKKEDIVNILPQQSTESSMPAVAPGAHTPNSGTYSELAKVAAGICVLNSGASLAVQPSVGVSKTASPFKTAPPFLTQRGVPLMMANSCPAAQPAPQHTLHAATSPGNLNIPYRALSALDFHQAFLALSSTFSPAMWCPPLAAANHYATPFIPSLNPWAAAGLTMPLNWNVLNSPSAAPSMTSPTAASAHNAISQFMHAAPPESMGGPQAQAMPSEPNTAPPYRVDIT